MDRDTLVLSACLACAGSSNELARWLSEPAANINDLLSPARRRRARIREQTSQRLVKLLKCGEPQRVRGQLEQDGWQILTAASSEWPPLLVDIDAAPALLFVRGNAQLLGRPQLAMVGARHASAEGLDNARRFARVLAGAGFTITSGLALGIDRAAHEGALQAGTTIAVLGHGPGPCYPPRNRPLAEQIIHGSGTLVTEFPPGLAPRKEFFPQRNRLISGLSLATIVVEAAEHSGSLITARLALQQGREVFAIPGSIHNPLSKGCHRLLRDGANWLESLHDVQAVFSSLTSLAESTSERSGCGHSRHTDPLLRHFITGPNSIDQLHQRSGIAIQDLTSKLSSLEISGHIQRVAGGYCRRYPGNEIS
ncbi:DNA-processing protein DprA [Alcanivorax sp. 1008]|uniref:DNA-processing protein DprA n=1 Tax=Alcanivorax sp. 1008 TaxID=2816853 RepID=UPI001D75140E|nr:DNA-processing protein DprA [Alcanivorax sp. 1008]MCC1496229.1 DNA-processing protein DprA [Alcanivorax sp. 1008]